MKKAKKLWVAVIALISAATIWGCGQGENYPKEQNEIAGANTEEENGMSYDEKSLELLKEVLGCEQKDAESVLRSLGRQKIGVFSEAEQLEDPDSYVVRIKTEAGQEYVLYIDKKYHLFAIQKDSRQGEYVYMELE